MRISEWKIKLLTKMAVILSLLTVFLVLCGSSQAGTDNTVSISVPVSEIKPAKIQQVTGNQAVINTGEFPQGGSPGDPMLPYKSLTLLVPPDADLEMVTASLASQSWEDLPGEYDIAPVKPAATSDGQRLTISWGNKDKSLIVNGRDISIYNNDAYFPSVPVQIVSVGKFRQFKLVELRVWMAVYNPVQKKVRVLKDAQVTLAVQKLSAARATGLNSAVLPRIPKAEKFAGKLRPKIANPQDLDAFYGQTTAPAAQSGGPAPLNVSADYVIITTNSIVTNCPKIATFAAAKVAAGFTVNTVMEAPAAGDSRYVQGNTCDERANNIRAWLQAHYIPDGIEYVLLIGDPRPDLFTANQSVPMKWSWPRNGQAGPIDEIKCPTDMYFAELSGNWDLDADLKYGEFSGDYAPGGADKNCELKVGRIPLYNSQYADVCSILQKSIDYGSAAGNLAWRSKVLIPAAISNFSPEDTTGDGVEDWPFIDAGDRTFGDDWGETIKAHATAISFSPYTLYEKQGIYGNGSAYPLTACNANLTNANVINEWKNKYGFVTWWAHGNASSASRFRWIVDNQFPNICTTPAETTFNDMLFQWGDCASLDNNYPSFVVQVSCDNGWPESTINLGYSLLKQGAIGTISGTRVTWYSVGPWDTGLGGNVGDNASYGYYCFDRMANSAEDIGTALVYCRSNFGTNWNDGGSWMNMVGFNLYGDPSLKLGLPPGSVKWEQLPDTTEYSGVDIRFDRSDGINRLLADDFLCTTTGPINRVKLWGSWHNDIKCQIKKIHLSIHNDKPADGTGGHSEPNSLLWSKDFSPPDFNETLYNPYVEECWWDPYTMMEVQFPGDTQIWQYDINIPHSAFVQEGNSTNPIVYWLDAYAELDPIDPNFLMAQFGWKTSTQHWNDDSVWFQWNQWNELRYPSGHPHYYESIDLSFGIYTGEESNEVSAPLKWSQPPLEIHPEQATITYCGWDEKSFNKDANLVEPWKIVADDFRCLGSMPITSIHWWGSHTWWQEDSQPPAGNLPIAWQIGFWSNAPADGNFPYSRPEILLHTFQVPAARVTSKIVGHDEYGIVPPRDTCFKYSLDLEPNEVFWQNDFNAVTDNNIFWLSITAVYDQLQSAPTYPWGWKSRTMSWMDASVTFNLPAFPVSGQMLDPNKVTPIIGEFFNENTDMSFELDTDPNYVKWDQPFTGLRDWPHYEDEVSEAGILYEEPFIVNLVADDWRCLRRTPITAVVWWGSYLNYQRPVCSDPIMAAPIVPDYFLLNMWTDVPADPCVLNSFSHPGHKIWEYKAYTYDEVMVGFDKHPEGAPTEPVYRYSVRLPQNKWFHVPDYNAIYWFSVVAVYGGIQDYDWGWTNHAHSFNDDAVTGTITNPGSPNPNWAWVELEDQTGASEDMSFILFTDPNECSTCANYNLDNIVNFLDYADFAPNWLNVVPPGGYNNFDLNCDGVIDLSDVKIFTQQWLAAYP
jgi:hypothetical protein